MPEPQYAPTRAVPGPAPAAVKRPASSAAGPGTARVGAYCGSGINACALVLALEESGVTARAAPAALYPGSWSEWSTDPDRPAATGERESR